MPRFARAVVPECPHHVTQRGNERRDIFFNVQDRGVYLGLLKQYKEHYEVDVTGYCLMDNHVHLVLVPHSPDSMAKFFRCVHMRYSQYRHAIEGGSGHLWQNRYYSCAFEPEQLGNVMRYVELNPVRAGMVSRATDFPWSSASVHTGQVDTWGMLDLRQWNQSWSIADWQEVLTTEADDADMIREATHSGRPIGSEEFVRGLEQYLKRPLARRAPGRPRKLARGAMVAGEM